MQNAANNLNLNVLTIHINLFSKAIAPTKIEFPFWEVLGIGTLFQLSYPYRSLSLCKTSRM